MTSDTHEFELELGAYALGALDPDERRTLEAHLSTCTRCQAALVEYQNVSIGIGLATDAADPPPRVKARILAQVTGDDLPRPMRRSDSFVERSPGRRASDLSAHRGAPVRSKSPVWRLVAAAGVLLAVATGLYAMLLRSQLAEAQATMQASLARAASLANELSAARRDSARLIRVVDVLSAPDLIRVDLRGQAGAPAAVGRAFVSRAQGLLFDARNLPALGPDRVYQLWVIAAGGPVSAGLITLTPEGLGTLTGALPAGVPAPTALAVTAEPAGGSPGPTTAVLLVGETKG